VLPRCGDSGTERSAEIFITAADSWQIYDRHLVNLRPPRAHIYVLWTTVFASPSRTVVGMATTIWTLLSIFVIAPVGALAFDGLLHGNWIWHIDPEKAMDYQ